MKKILRWISPRVTAPEGRLLLGALYGMLELYGYKVTLQTTFVLVKGAFSNGRKRNKSL